MNTTPDPDRPTMRGCVDQCEWCPGATRAGTGMHRLHTPNSPATASEDNRGIGSANVKRVPDSSIIWAATGVCGVPVDIDPSALCRVGREVGLSAMVTHASHV